ncbi:F0F1 ATP synthase subunit gamma [Leptolyngbya iicbica]|uniref:F0F1 ATP synthase subunit gamma n=2 Tax=Cyanophyceae TaxID=3028117 RepID=A0A4Q7EEH3_9CYAN|nr:F0F1 ATP synthase subunit gamma [Leptolyngbya sp. LK]RZM82224.1 F0F1 ATP synthase subunit gamma [Leptolyngbya sp. LK]
MQTPEALKSQIGSTADLQSVVKTMKAQAAVSIQQYEAALASLQQYSHTLELGLQILLQQSASVAPPAALAPASSSPDPLGIILFGSDQGLCGQFNQQIAQYLDRYLGDPPIAIAEQRHLAVVGARPLPTLQELGLRIDETFAVPSNVDGITATVQDLLLMIDRWQTHWGTIGSRGLVPNQRILLFYNRPTSSVAYESVIVQPLPLDEAWLAQLRQRPWPSRRLPTPLMDPETLFFKLVRQYLFISLYQALAASLASENASRLAAMQAAESNIDDRLEDLTRQYRQQRQSAITAELLDVISGFEALTGQ